MRRAIIFDFDGLILDTETPELRSWQEIFRSFGQEYPEWYWRYALGRGAEQVAQRPVDLLREFGAVFNEEEVVEQRTRILFEMIDALPIQPGVERLLAEARSLGLPIGIASSSRHEWVDGHLDRLGLLRAFDQILCADDVSRAKPYPDLYLECCRRLGCPPGCAVALEDSVNGSIAAREAGLFVVAVPTHLTEREGLDADLILDSLEHLDLPSLIQGR